MNEVFNFTSELSPQEFKLFAQLIYKLAGIHLRETKMALVANRLRKRLKALNINSYLEYYEYITKNDPKAKEELIHFIDAITTNETYFFRHESDFEFLRDVIIPEVVKNQEHLKNKSIKIWSAASSTGEEPYSIAMIVAETLGDDPNWNIQILASDINTEVLKTAEAGIYGQYAVSRLNNYAINKYFEKVKSNTNEEKYAVKPQYKKLVKFKRHNLKDPMLILKFHCIFCRNVLIYFDNESKEKVIQNLYNALVDDGYLILGHAESLMRIKSNFKYVRPSIYKK